MGKARTNRYGNTKQQELLNENKQLKKQISSLRKRLARIDLDRYDTVKELIQEHYQQDRAEQGKEILNDLKQTWLCRVCEEGYLEILIYNHSNTTFYYRKCTDCTNRTKPKKYSTDVKGIVKNLT